MIAILFQLEVQYVKFVERIPLALSANSFETSLKGIGTKDRV